MGWKYPKWLCASHHDRMRDRESLKYRRKPHHRKKERDDSWREHKKVQKDKAKRGWSRTRSGAARGCHSWFKNQSNRIERRSVKRKLYQGDWDNWQNFQRDLYLDPWGWD